MNVQEKEVKLEDVVMTVHEVAKYLHFSEAKVYQMTRQGHVPAIRLGKAWRFRRDLLDEWLRREAEKTFRVSE